MLVEINHPLALLEKKRNGNQMRYCCVEMLFYFTISFHEISCCVSIYPAE